MTQKIKWGLRKLDELGTVGRGKSRHRPRNDDRLYGGQYPFIQTADVMAANPYISQYSQTYSEFGLGQSKLWPAQTLCMTIAGANTAKTAILKFDACFPDSIVGFLPNPTKSNIYFVKYSLDAMRQRFLDVSRGATQDNLSLDKLLSFPIDTPPIEIQNRIAAVLAAYDDLIENCERRIRVLDEMARKLYREWFVHFRYPGHENVPLVDSALGKIPKGWEIASLFEVADVAYGYPFKSDKFSSNVEGLPIVRIRDVLGGVSQVFTTEVADEKYLLNVNDILIGMDGEFHMSIWWGSPAWQNQRIARLRAGSQISPLWLFFLIQPEVKRLNKEIVGTTVAHLGDAHLRRLRFVRPPLELRGEFSKSFDRMLGLSGGLRRRVANLRRTRDLLLPRLLSGQLDVGAMA